MARIAVSTFIESIGGHPVVVKHRWVGTVDQPSIHHPVIVDVGENTPTLLAERQTELEGRWLRAARHRHVVRLRRALPTEAALATDHAGLHSLATCHPTPTALASILATVGSTLAELHGRGLVHGQLVPAHLVLRGTHLLDPALCSPAPSAEAERPHPRRDVAALAVMACDLMTADLERGGSARSWAGWSEAIKELADDHAALNALAASEMFASLARGPRRSWFRG